ETFRWTVVQPVDSPAGPVGRRSGGKPGTGSGAFSPSPRLVALQKSYQCRECGKSFSCGSHFGKHRRTHTG
ncbi:ZN383 protein, partial [Pluvianellus socialis]|nr:ZN383 protein [Pluvianellus socialis]